MAVVSPIFTSELFHQGRDQLSSLIFVQGAIVADHLNVEGLGQDTATEAHLGPGGQATL